MLWAELKNHLYASYAAENKSKWQIFDFFPPVFFMLFFYETNVHAQTIFWQKGTISYT